MSQKATSVLDASALLAYLQGEPGAETVACALIQNSAISSINWAETLSELPTFPLRVNVGFELHRPLPPT
ncbi:MAG: hypothetical protein SAK29_07950 [Scytonema sp. PMC 1069.18]|nr:hypothetical protein [Scytonema sp. PMC 1069.18]MEC4887702.1 hypothetical protein [Scytonema sp. PMC 1070.18]